MGIPNKLLGKGIRVTASVHCSSGNGFLDFHNREAGYLIIVGKCREDVGRVTARIEDGNELVVRGYELIIRLGFIQAGDGFIQAGDGFEGWVEARDGGFRSRASVRPSGSRYSIARV